MRGAWVMRCARPALTPFALPLPLPLLSARAASAAVVDCATARAADSMPLSSDAVLRRAGRGDPEDVTMGFLGKPGSKGLKREGLPLRVLHEVLHEVLPEVLHEVPPDV